jgi:hypothetical protein
MREGMGNGWGGGKEEGESGGRGEWGLRRRV